MKQTTLAKITFRLLLAALLMGSALSFSGCGGTVRMETSSDFVNGGKPTVREW